MRIEALSGWTREQKHVVAASFLGWTLDAFDFFLLVFVLKDIAQEFNTQITDVTFAILLTLAMRPIGAYLFGRAADRWGRRPTLMVDVLLYSIIEFASGFAPSLTILLVLRAIFGIAMGGEWGVGASLTMEFYSAARSRFCIRVATIGLSDGIFPRFDRVWRTIPIYRLARDVYDRSPPGPPCFVYSPHGTGIPNLDTYIR